MALDLKMVEGYFSAMDNLTIYGNHDDNTLAQMANCMKFDFAVRGALCADGHLGYGQPIGGVVAYEDHISLSGVGFDIGCGNRAIKTNIKFSDVSREWLVELANKIQSNISFGVGRNNQNLNVENYLFEDGSHPAWNIPHIAELKRKAQNQFGTIGSGNHYIDVFKADSDDALWVGCHFGSRGLGHTIATHYLKAVGAKDDMNADPAILNVHTDHGREYLMGMDLAGLYANEARKWVLEQVAGMMGAEIVEAVSNHHNFAWNETIDGKSCWVARKGSTPLVPGQKGFVGGSMGDISVILSGKEMPVGLMASTIHGAGRVMSRTKAAGKSKWVKNEAGQRIKTRISAGVVDEEAERARLKGEGLILIGAGADEMPEVYRPLASVLEAHRDTVTIEETLRPVIVAMAGANEFDPWKD